jgi:hypothetical protein
MYFKLSEVSISTRTFDGKGNTVAEALLDLRAGLGIVYVRLSCRPNMLDYDIREKSAADNP